MTAIPYNWVQATIGAVAEIQLGKMLDKEKNKGEPTLYLRNINVRWGNFKLDDLSEMRVTEAEKQQFNILDGDLLICEGGEPGRCAVWTGGDNDLAFQKALIRVRPFPGILSNWIAKFLMFEEQQGDLENYFTGTTIKHLPAVSLAKVPLLVPPLAEQRRIIAKIDSLLARSVRARAELSRIVGISPEARSASALLDRLDQAILAKAFRGELVPQDPNDEPASVLLDRIRAERAATPAPRAHRGRKT